jgi:protein tyrosine/serine phosphatase
MEWKRTRGGGGGGVHKGRMTDGHENDPDSVQVIVSIYDMRSNEEVSKEKLLFSL